MKRFCIIFGLAFACLRALAGGIGSAADLQAFIDACNKGESLLAWSDADSTVVLTADIDLAKAKKLKQVDLFKGRFDGKGFRILNWKATRGLFHVIARGAEVSNIIIDASCSMKASGKGEEFRAGFIADSNDGIIAGCTNYGSISHSCDFAMAPSWIGGIVGYNRFAVKECANYGTITSDTLGEPKEEIFVGLGGIAGGSVGKALAGSVVAHCSNYGTVRGISNLQALYIGGICGNSGRTTIKYCINRGEVTVETGEPEGGQAIASARVGGVAGLAKADIVRCDNFGTVSLKGAAGTNIAGICGMPHDALVIADCSNFGAVTASGDNPSNAGGIAGAIGRPVHIRGCSNYGKISFDGVSSRARSTVAGIAGNIYCPKSQTAGASVRECINYGEVYAGSGGNKYDSNNANAIHAAGVVAYAEIRQGITTFVSNCTNKGKVSCSGRKGDIYASATGVKTGGAAAYDYAEVLQTAPASGNVCGSVLSSDGKPLEGIVVTDGRNCVTTAADGSYAMNSNLEEVNFIYLSLPAGVKHSIDRNPIPFKRVPRFCQAVKADFTLEMTENSDDYTIMMIADPQVRPYGMDNSMEVWNDVVAPDAEAFRAAAKGNVYCINLGDLVYNYMYAWDDYMDVAAKIKCPTFNVIGNHDFDQGTLFEIEQGNVYYETYVGPDHFSFDLGRQHFIVVNDIMYDRKSAADKYYYGLDERSMQWLENDLANVPKDKIIVICAHAQLFKNPASSPNGSHGAYFRNYDRYRKLLASYRKVYSWCGHYHQNYYYNYEGKKTRHGAPNIQCISVARCTGALRLNREIGPAGEPRGYMVLNVKGDEFDWYYKPVGEGKENQMKVYSPDRSEDGVIKANIWNWSEGWSTPEWYENGVKVADMESTPGVDPDYYDLYATVENKTTRKYCTPSTEAIIFSCKPTPGATSGEVRVKDMFGNEYVRAIEWKDNQ